MGFINARRNIARSFFSIISMALATGFLAFAFSFSRGYSSGLFLAPAAIFGGDIAVYSLSFDGSIGEDSSARIYQRLENSYSSDLAVFYPELARDGFVTPAGSELLFSEDELQAFGSVPGVSGVYPRFQIPALSSNQGASWCTPLRGRSPDLDDNLRMHPSELLSAGRWFSPQDEGLPVAVVSAYNNYPRGSEPIRPGDILRIQLPRAYAKDGRNYFDFSDLIDIELSVIGTIAVPTRTLRWVGFVEGTQVWLQWDLHWLLDEIQVPLSTWQNIWQHISSDPYYPEQVNLIATDISFLEDIVAEVRLSSPQRTATSIARIMGKAQRELLIEDRSLFAEYEAWSGIKLVTDDEKPGLARDLRLPLAILIFAMSGLVVAANLLLMVDERRREIGILKAVGALRINIAQMILAEAVFLSCMGGSIGFLIFRLPALVNQLSGGGSASLIWLIFCKDLLITFASAVLAAITFGLLPAWQSASVKPQILLSE